jgi:hypothetical protein
VKQEVVAKADYSDSTLWTFKESRIYCRDEGSVARGFIDTTLSDSMTYVLVELKSDRHRLFQQLPYEDYGWGGHYHRAYGSAFPFWRDTWDSLYVFRFCTVDSASAAAFNLSGIERRPNARRFTLRKDVGLLSLELTGTMTLDQTEAAFQLVNYIITDVARNPGGDLPTSLSLFQNYPNPFNPSTTIRYALPHRSHLILTVFTMLGQQVATLVNGEVEAGYHEITFNAEALSSGVYFYRLQVGDFNQTKRLCLIK